MTALWAVHILDGVLNAGWLIGGFLLAAPMIWWGNRDLSDEEIPRIAIMSAAFFISSLIHVPVGVSVHLLLNGLVGVILGRRALLAIPIALILQTVLLGHGGPLTLGVNICVMAIPALMMSWLFRKCVRMRGLYRPRALWAVGFVIGGIGVFLTVLLNACVLWLGATESAGNVAGVVLAAHLPIVAVEAFVMAVTVSFLARVKPEMIGL